MDASTTLYTFMLYIPSDSDKQGLEVDTLYSQCPHAAQSVQLVGSWDNFKTPYPMVKDTAKGLGHWTGCHAFEGVLCGDGLNKGPASGSGGLRMGETYWYYYRLDGARDYCDSVQPLTMSCPMLPDQVVNVLQLPCEVVDQRPSPSGHDESPYIPKTLNPQHRYQVPKPPRPIDSDIRTLPASTRGTAHSVVPNSTPISRAGCGPDSVQRSLIGRRRLLSTFSICERLVEHTAQSICESALRPNGLPLGPVDPSADWGHAKRPFSHSEHRRARSAPASASALRGGDGKSESALTHDDRPMTLQTIDRSPPAQEHPSNDRYVVGSGFTREPSPCRASVNNSRSLPELPCLERGLCAAFSFDLLAEFPDNERTTQELQSPSLTYSSTSPDIKESPYRAYEQPSQIYDHEDGKEHSETLHDLLHSCASLQSALSDYQLYPPALTIDTTSYNIARTPAYISPIVGPLGSSSLPQTQSSTGEVPGGSELRRSPSIRQDNASPQKCDSGIALVEGDKPFVEDLMSELRYLCGVIA